LSVLLYVVAGCSSCSPCSARRPRELVRSCASTNGGVTKTKSGAASPITVSGLTVGKSYKCLVNATNSRGTGPFSNPSAPMNA
jgi:hypothetical protein